MEKTTISFLMFDQALINVELAIDSKTKNNIDIEVQNSISSILLLGIVLEGIANDLGNNILDTWTLNHFDRSTPQLKWKIISDKLKLNFTPSEKPLQIIDEIFKKRNRIAHPKPLSVDKDVMVTTPTDLIINPKDDFILPNEDLNIYIGFGKLHKEFNAKQSVFYLKEVYNLLLTIKKKNKKIMLQWVDSYKEKINKL